MVDSRSALAFAGAVAAVSLIDAAEVAYLDSKSAPTDDELAASAERVVRIIACHEALKRVRQRLGGEESKADLKQLLIDVQEIVKLGRAFGIKVDLSKVGAPLSALEEFVR